MKRLFFFLLLTISPLAASAQVIVDGKDITRLPDVEYIELIVDRRLFRQGQVFAVIDYGQTIRWGTLRIHRVKDEVGNDKIFGSEMDIFNFLYRNGWTHETTTAGDDFIYHIFRRKAKLE